jgi:hypothetical protein
MFILISVFIHKQAMMYYKVRESPTYVIMSLTYVKYVIMSLTYVKYVIMSLTYVIMSLTLVMQFYILIFSVLLRFYLFNVLFVRFSPKSSKLTQ